MNDSFMPLFRNVRNAGASFTQAMSFSAKVMRVTSPMGFSKASLKSRCTTSTTITRVKQETPFFALHVMHIMVNRLRKMHTQD